MFNGSNFSLTFLTAFLNLVPSFSLKGSSISPTLKNEITSINLSARTAKFFEFDVILFAIAAFCWVMVFSVCTELLIWTEFEFCSTLNERIT